MNDQTNMAQLRYLEELKIGLVHAGFEPERIEDQHLPVRWENHYLCRVSGRGSVLYRQENVDGIGAQDALQTAINTAAMTAEYMTAMERAPKLQATGLEGDYRILADFGDAVLAGRPVCDVGVGLGPQGCPPRSLLPKRLRGGQARLCPTQRASSQGSTVRARTTRRDTSGIGFRLRAGRGSIYRKGKGNQDHHGADQVPIAGISGTDADNGTKYVSGVDHSTPLFFVGGTTR